MILAGLTGAASAQGLRGGLGGLGGVLDQPLRGLGALRDQTLADATNLNAQGLAEQRLARMRDLVRANPKTLDLDAAGAPVVRGEVLALSPTRAALEIARKAGFSIARHVDTGGLGLDLVVLTPPDGMAARVALKQLRKLDPTGRYDLDHLYSGAGEAGAGGSGAPGGAAIKTDPKVRVGLLDTGVARGHPAFAAGRVEQRGFAPGGVRPGAHGTAVASLMVGDAARFRGAAPGATLFAADVYGSGPTGGSAQAIVGALAWMVENRTPVINISLVGPADLTLEAAIRAVQARGALIVAAVGNDGPAAPPLYPASYPGVIAVTGVDGRGRILFEAGRATHVDFAARGADLIAAQPGGGFGDVRGTSFAAPIVAARLALMIREPDRAEAARAVTRLGAEAHPLPDRDSQRLAGRGLVD